MPAKGNPNRAFRLDDLGLWDRFGQVAEPDRSAVLREFIRYYVGDLPRPPRRPVILRSVDPGA